MSPDPSVVAVSSDDAHRFSKPNPGAIACGQINGFQAAGLLKEVVHQDEHGNVVREAGIMSVVLDGGEVRAGDPITVELPATPHEALDWV